jgi:SOS-response transcriptional repressor LexA
VSALAPRARDIETVAAIRRLTLELGYPPTFDEIGADVGVRSKSTVFRRVERLRQLGWIENAHGPHDYRSPRSMSLTGRGLLAIESLWPAKENA